MNKIHSFVSKILLFLCFISLNRIEAVWNLPAVTISDTGSTVPEVGVDECCNAVAVWQESNGTNTIIMGSTLPVNGTWTTPVPLSLSGQNATIPQVAVDPNGNAVAVWSRSNGTNSIIQGAILPFGTTSWILTTDLSLPGQNANVPQVAVAPNGNAVVVWVRIDGGTGKNVTQGATLAFGTSVLRNLIWTPTSDLSSNLIDTFVPQVSVDAAGNAVAVWTAAPDQQIQAATLNSGTTTWSPFQTISLVLANQPQVSMNASGYAVVTWERFAGTNNFIVESSNLQFGGSWSSPLAASAGGISQQSDVAVDPAGNAVAVWSNAPSLPDFFIGAATLPKGASNWSSVTTLTTSGSALNARVAVDAAGNAIAVWDNNDGTNVFIQASMLPLGGSWTLPATDLAAVGEDADSQIAAPKIAITPTGYAVVVWRNLAATTIDATTWTLPPTVTNVSPNHGPTSGENTVIITGTNFINVTGVKFGANNALEFTSHCCTSIEAVVHPGAPGTVDVTVTTPVGTSALTPNDYYTYDKGPSRPPKPTHFIGNIKKRPHPTRERPYELRASWERSHSQNIAFYKIYANHSVIKKVSNMKKPFFRQFRDTKHLHRKYRITSISKNGRESRKEKLKLKTG